METAAKPSASARRRAASTTACLVRVPRRGVAGRARLGTSPCVDGSSTGSSYLYGVSEEGSMTAEITARPAAPTSIDPRLRRLALVVLSGAIMPLLDTTIVVIAINELGRQFH